MTLSFLQNEALQRILVNKKWKTYTLANIIQIENCNRHYFTWTSWLYACELNNEYRRVFDEFIE